MGKKMKGLRDEGGLLKRRELGERRGVLGSFSTIASGFV